MYSRQWSGRVINTEESTDTPLWSSRRATGKAMTLGGRGPLSRDPGNGPGSSAARARGERKIRPTRFACSFLVPFSSASPAAADFHRRKNDWISKDLSFVSFFFSFCEAFEN